MGVDDCLCGDMSYVHKLWTEEVNGLMNICRNGSMEIVVKQI